MTSRREQVLRKVIRPLDEDKAPQLVRADGPQALAWKELGVVVGGLVFAQRPIRAASAEVTRRHGLGPRGAFILSLLSHGIVFPHEIAVVLRVGRSLVTAELARLTEAGLITARPAKDDRRRSELALTPAGEAAGAEVREAVARILTRNLASYTADEVRMFGRMLRDVSRLDDEELESAERTRR